MTFKGEHIALRALEPGDLDFLYELENNPLVWEISGTTAPYSRHLLQRYLDNAHRDIYEVKQLRLAIVGPGEAVLGFIDLFDFDPKNGRAGLGIVILDENNRGRGLGSEAVGLVCDYAFATLQLHQLYAHVLENNVASIRMFQKLGFEATGIRKDWIRSGNGYIDELLFQKIST